MSYSNHIVSFFDEVLNEKKCYELAKKCRFIERSSSKIRGYEFAKALIIPDNCLSTDSLKGLCSRMREFNPEADLSAQALCERINDASAKKFIKEIYSAILAHIRSSKNNFNEIKALEKFDSVYIEDSTVMKLNEKLQDDFKGTNRGGTGAKSQVKIDLIYDLMKDTILDAEIYNGKDPDQGLAGRIIPMVKAGNLVIRDQGYFVLKVFQKFIDLGVFFISRLLPHVMVYLNKEDTDPVDLGKHLKNHYRDTSIVDIPQVFLGQEKVPVRLVFYRLPKDVVEVKLREANKRARETGRQMSAGKKLLLHFAAFITTVNADVISAQIIGNIYRLRWEIELIFKRWKSQLKIDYLEGISKNRIECLIWSRLCSILIIEIINGYIAGVAIKVSQGLEISHVKILSYMLNRSSFYRSIVRNRIEQFLCDMGKDIRRMLLKDKRKRKTMRGRVNDQEFYYGKQPTDTQFVA